MFYLFFLVKELPYLSAATNAGPRGSVWKQWGQQQWLIMFIQESAPCQAIWTSGMFLDLELPMTGQKDLKGNPP